MKVNTTNRMKRSVIYGLGLALLLPISLSVPPKPPNRLDLIREKGELVVLTRNAPTTFYEYRDQPAGLEYEMAKAFADSLGVRVRFRVLDSVPAVLDALSDGTGDIAAAGMIRTATRSERFDFGPNYQTVQQQVVCRRNGAVPRRVSDLVDVRLGVVSRSSYAEHLERLRANHPGLNWEAKEGMESEQLLEQVWRGKLDCTVASSNIISINRRYYPELLVALPLGQPQRLAWALPKGESELKSAVDRWFKKFKSGGKLDSLLERYYGFAGYFDYVDVRVFKRRVRSVLPYYRPMFEAAAKRYGLPWTLVAVQGYQESNWDPDAVSPTGVRGIMMLTRNTANSLKIGNRKNPSESIMGGARYMASLYRQLPPEIAEPDRTWIALAAYNVGMGHVQDAQMLARILGKNPNLWKDLKTVLPLLSQKRFYRFLKHGYARGTEPVDYVQRIRDYHNILEQSLKEFDYKVSRTDYVSPSSVPGLNPSL
jgi:membrane-bound lytic murein transglycosylase F